MRFSSFRYLVKQGWKNMAANRLMTMAGIGVLTACLIITGLAAILTVDVNNIVDYLAGQNEIIVNLLVELDDGQAAAMGEQIASIPNVRELSFISKEDAYNIMQGMFQEYGDLLAGYEQIFNAQYKVTVEDLGYIEQTNAQIMALPGVESTHVPSELAGVMIMIKNFVTYGGLGIVIILLLVSIIVISNTIRMSVFSRRKEISIMKYVGATNSFIRLPFFVEGMTVGIIAGILSTAVVCGGYFFVYDYMHKMYNIWVMGIMASLLTVSEIWLPLGLCFVGIGIILGGFGTASSVRKHLKV